MLILTFLFLGIVVFADVVYLSRISDALTREENRIIINYETGQNLFIANAWSTLITFLIFMAAVVVLLAALPLYSKLLRKINTSIDVEGNTNMTTVDISEED